MIYPVKDAFPSFFFFVYNSLPWVFPQLECGSIGLKFKYLPSCKIIFCICYFVLELIGI
jgi:hypothetical protein